MKKMMLLMLTLLIGSVASMNAQVRIGATLDPDTSAVLDLNKNNNNTGSTLGLALPRVNVTGEGMYLNGYTDIAPKNGTMVYNTNKTFGTGVLYWDGGEEGKWVAQGMTRVDLEPSIATITPKGSVVTWTKVAIITFPLATGGNTYYRLSLPSGTLQSNDLCLSHQILLCTSSPDALFIFRPSQTTAAMTAEIECYRPSN